MATSRRTKASAIRRLHVFALATLIGCPALVLAQAKDATRSYDRATSGSSNIRNFTLRNTAANTIADARVRLSDNSTRVLTETGPITKSHNQTFAAPNKACVTEVKVQFRVAAPWKPRASMTAPPRPSWSRTAASSPKAPRPPGHLRRRRSRRRIKPRPV